MTIAALKTIFLGANSKDRRPFTENKAKTVVHIGLMAILATAAVLLNLQQINGTFNYVFDGLKQDLGPQLFDKIFTGAMIPVNGLLCGIVMHTVQDGGGYVVDKIKEITTEVDE